MQGLNVGRRLGVIGEGLAQHADRLGQGRVRDEGVLPDRIDKLLTRDNVTGAVQEQLEHSQDPGWQRDFQSATAEEPRPRVERKRPEREAGKSLTVGSN